MICGLCGNNEMFKFRIVNKEKEDKDGNQFPAVFITCENCSTLTGLDEVIKDETKHKIETKTVDIDENKLSMEAVKRYPKSDKERSAFIAGIIWAEQEIENM